jgi:hypothetical protein
MLGKKILAGIFAGFVIVKLIFLIATPDKWLGLTQWFLEHSAVLMVINLILLIIAGYYIFISLDLIDVAVVMLFTSSLAALSLIPYAASMMRLREEMLGEGGMYKAIFPLMVWGGIAGALLCRVFKRKRLREKGNEFQ